MPRYILRPVNGAKPYILIDIDAAEEQWRWRRLDETGQLMNVADQMGDEPTLEDAFKAACRRFGAEIYADVPNDDAGVRKLREANAKWST